MLMYALYDRNAPITRNTTASPAMNPVSWPKFAPFRRADRKQYANEAADDRDQNRPVSGPVIVHTHNGEPCHEGKDSGHQHQCRIARNRLDQRRDRAEINEQRGRKRDEGGADQASEGLRICHEWSPSASRTT